MYSFRKAWKGITIQKDEERGIISADPVLYCGGGCCTGCACCFNIFYCRY
ncbi:MAG: hypothetical protein HXS46_03585 [Theionarchaea archaeon]|nr:hypothetical protein [Theionarchaea archaeon]